MDRSRFDKHRKMIKDGVRPDQTCTCDKDVAVPGGAARINCFDTQKGILENYRSELDAASPSPESIKTVFTRQVDAEGPTGENQIQDISASASK